jgi:orsellinic acid C2-O-methyltransferase
VAAANHVNMLVCTGGRQRSEAEVRSLYRVASFALARVITTNLPYASIIEGVLE